MNRKQSDDPDRLQVARRTPRLLRLPDVLKLVSISKTHVYALMAAGPFPQPIRISARAVRWIESEVLDFIATRPRAGSDRRPRR